MAFEGRGGMWVSSRQFGAIVEALTGGFERVAMRRRMWADFGGVFLGGVSYVRARVHPHTIFLVNSLGGLKGIAWGRGEGNNNTTVFSYRGTQGGFLFTGKGRKGGTLKRRPLSADHPKNGDN